MFGKSLSREGRLVEVKLVNGVLKRGDGCILLVCLGGISGERVKGL